MKNMLTGSQFMQSKEGAVGGECVSRVVPRPYGRGAEGQGTTFRNTYCGINTCPTRPVVQLCGVRFAGCYEQSSMASESSAVSQRFPSAPSLQLPSGQEVSEILQQTCAEVSQTTTAEIVELGCELGSSTEQTARSSAGLFLFVAAAESRGSDHLPASHLLHSVARRE